MHGIRVFRTELADRGKLFTIGPDVRWPLPMDGPAVVDRAVYVHPSRWDEFCLRVEALSKVWPSEEEGE